MALNSSNPAFVFYCARCQHKVEHRIDLVDKNLRKHIRVICEQMHVLDLDVIDLVILNADVQEVNAELEEEEKEKEEDTKEAFTPWYRKW